MLLLNNLQDVGLLLLRIAIGIIFIYHGFPKIRKSKEMANSMGKPNMSGFLIFLGTAETLGGIATILGLLTQIANIGFIIVMLGAIYMKKYKWNVPFFAMDKTGWEFDFLLLVAAAALVLLGAGSYSVDAAIRLFP